MPRQWRRRRRNRCSTTRSNRKEFRETVLRVAVESDSRDAVERFSRELMPYITAGPQGTTGYAEGRPRVHPVFRYWPCLIARDAVVPHVEILPSAVVAKAASPAAASTAAANPPAIRPAQSAQASHAVTSGREKPTCLYDIACARSGDKGSSANVGVIARSPEAWDVSANVAHGRPCGRFPVPTGN